MHTQGYELFYSIWSRKGKIQKIEGVGTYKGKIGRENTGGHREN